MSDLTDDDGDEPAITAGIEPADTIESATAAALDPPERLTFGGADEVIERPKGQQRVISQKARDLFKKAADSVKKQMVEEDESFEHGVAAVEPEPPAPDPVKTEPAKQPDHVQPAAVGGEPAAVTPPAPALDPMIEQFRQRLDARQAEIEERGKALAEREKTIATDFDGLRETYLESPTKATTAYIRRMIGAADGDDITEEVADLITALSGDVLKVPLTADVRRALEAKQALKYVKANKQQLSKREEAIEARRVAEEEKQSRSRAITGLGEEMKNHAKTYPWLMEEENPAEKVVEVIEYQFRQDGTRLSWTEAAQRAENYYKQMGGRYYDKRRHLLSAAPDKASPKPAEAIVPQGDPSGIRRSHTITNAASAATATPKPKPPIPAVDANGKWNREAHRAQTMAKFRKARTAFGEQPPDE